MWDVIIVGAGPAGSCAAYHLARKGARVLLADRQAFPRDKVCGDGVSANGLALLTEMGLADWLAKEAFCEPRTLLLSAPNGQSVSIAYQPRGFSYGRTIPRFRLDEALLTCATEAGAHFAAGYHIRHCERTNHPSIRVEGIQGGQTKTEEARLAILAEGAQAGLARLLGLVCTPPDLVAVRGYFSGAAEPDSLLEIHYHSSVSPGYVWIFPLGGGRVNVGLGTFVQRAKQGQTNLTAVLHRAMAESHPLKRRLGGSRPDGPIRGHSLRTGVGKARLCTDHVLVAGEAAHLVNPLTGEGIAAALESGKKAAHQACLALHKGDFSRATLAPYERAVRDRFLPEHRAALFIRRIFSHPAAVNRLVGKASSDSAFARALGEAIIGTVPIQTLLRPAMIAKYLL